METGLQLVENAHHIASHVPGFSLYRLGQLRTLRASQGAAELEIDHGSDHRVVLRLEGVVTLDLGVLGRHLLHVHELDVGRTDDNLLRLSDKGGMLWVECERVVAVRALVREGDGERVLWEAPPVPGLGAR